MGENVSERNLHVCAGRLGPTKYPSVSIQSLHSLSSSACVNAGDDREVDGDDAKCTMGKREDQ